LTVGAAVGAANSAAIGVVFEKPVYAAYSVTNRIAFDTANSTAVGATGVQQWPLQYQRTVSARFVAGQLQYELSQCTPRHLLCQLPLQLLHNSPRLLLYQLRYQLQFQLPLQLMFDSPRQLLYHLLYDSPGQLLYQRVSSRYEEHGR
jgi:hypothetical protein